MVHYKERAFISSFLYHSLLISCRHYFTHYQSHIRTKSHMKKERANKRSFLVMYHQLVSHYHTNLESFYSVLNQILPLTSSLTSHIGLSHSLIHQQCDTISLKPNMYNQLSDAAFEFLL